MEPGPSKRHRPNGQAEPVADIRASEAAVGTNRPAARRAKSGGAPASRTQVERSASSRRRLVAAAISCLNRHGYGATTLMLITQEAGISRGGLFHQYSSKADLMLDVVKSVFDHEVQLYRERLDLIDDPKERLLSILDAGWDILNRPGAIAVLEVMVGSRSDRELSAQLISLQKELEARIDATMQEHYLAAGVNPTLVGAPLRRLVAAAIRGLSIQRTLMTDDKDLVESVSVLKQMVMGHLHLKRSSLATGQ